MRYIYPTHILLIYILFTNILSLPTATSSGWVGGYTTEGADEGNRLKVETPAESHDGDSAAGEELIS